MSNPSSPKDPLYIPKPTRRSDGRAVVRLNGKDYYLGRFGSSAARNAYDKLIGEWLASNRRQPRPKDDADAPSVNEVLLAYFEYAKTYYRKPDGRPTSEIHCVRSALRPVFALYGLTDASRFDSLALKAVVGRMVADELTRKTVNDNMHRVRRAFTWAVAARMIPGSDNYQSLLAVDALQEGRCDAKEGKEVRPVAPAMVDAVRPYVAPQVWAMIQLQLLTGARPGEICILRACDLETSGRVWTYLPREHKTEHYEQGREIYIGPAAQEVLKPWLKLDTQAYLFSPAEADKDRQQQRRAERQTPLYPSHAERLEKKRKRKRGRAPGDHYTAQSYRRAIQRGCDLAFPPPAEWQDDASKADDVEQWRQEHRWFPHQLRHNAGTNVRKQFGIEMSRIILGHSTAFTTEIYAEEDREAAKGIIAKIG